MFAGPLTVSARRSNRIWLEHEPGRQGHTHSRGHEHPAALPRRHLRAENKSPRTIQSYEEAAEQFEAFLAQQGMPTAVAAIPREHDAYRNQLEGAAHVLTQLGNRVAMGPAEHLAPRSEAPPVFL